MSHFDRDGFAVIADFLTAERCCELIEAVEIARKTSSEPHAMRDILARIQAVHELASGEACRSLAESLIGPCRCVRGILFDKVPGANWKVAWHKDRSVALASRTECDGFGPWSVKAGIPHADAPADLLSRMVTLRIHLDPCDLENGPLRVIAGSHRDGKLTDPQIANWRADQTETICEVPAGGVLVMRPLLLHASSPATQPAHRRVIHLEYGPTKPADTLDWYDAV